MSEASTPLPDELADPDPSAQLTLLEGGFRADDAQLGVTFQDSRKEAVQRWYPYVEGFSAPYVRSLIGAAGYGSVFDPFGGAGTTQLTASTSGIASFYAEVNPFMSFVAETKVKVSRWAREHFSDFQKAESALIDNLCSAELKDNAEAVSLDSY